MRKDFVILSCIFAIAFGLRLYFVFFYPHYPVADDAQEYDTYAWNLASGKGYTAENGTAVINRAPGYPFFLAGIYKIYGHSQLAAESAQIIVSLFSLIILYLLAKDIFGLSAARIAVAIGAVYPAFISYNTFLYTETLFTFSLLCYVYFSWLAFKKKSIFYPVLAGLIIGYSVLVRGEALVLLPALFLFGLIFERKQLKKAALIILISICTIAPWTFRNYKVFHKFIPVSSQGGSILWIASYYDPARKGEWMLWHKDNQYFNDLIKGLDDVERDELLGRQGVENIRNHPFYYLRFSAKRFFMFWLSGHSNTFYKLSDELINYIRTKFYLKASIKLSMLVFNLIIICFGFYGALKAFNSGRERMKEIVFLFMPVMLIMIIHVLLCAIPRYQVPIMPFIIISASAAALSLRKRVI